MWKIEFYNSRVEDDIFKWPKNLKAKFLKIVEFMEKMGPYELGMPYIKPLKRGIFEIRIKSDEGIGRALFGNIKGKIIIILCAFIKKTQKTPAGVIELARKRMEEAKNDE